MPNDSDFQGRLRRATPTLPMKWESGGGGMVTTMSDFARFSQMMLNGGKLDGKRLSQPEGVRADDDRSHRPGLRRRRAIFSISPATALVSGSVLAYAPIPATQSRRRRARSAN